MDDQKHIHFMQYAINLSKRHLGLTAENPSVGCVIVHNNHIIGIGVTAMGGRPHAETQAISMAGTKTQNATAYVTLEPCATESKTPSCAKELVKAGIKKVFIACQDPDPRTNGKGIEILKQAGIEVVTGLLENEAKTVLSGFLSRIQKQKPNINLKIATSIDGKIALNNGKSQWITGDSARKHSHFLRSKHDAIVTGSGTINADNPQLNCRIKGLEHTSPTPIILSSSLNLNVNAKIFDNIKTIIFTSENYNRHNYHVLLNKNINIKIIENNFQLKTILNEISISGFNNLLIEGGKVLHSFYKENLWDKIYLYMSPIFLGNDSQAAIKNLNLSDLPQKHHIQNIQKLGNDVLYEIVR